MQEYEVYTAEPLPCALPLEFGQQQPPAEPSPGSLSPSLSNTTPTAPRDHGDSLGVFQSPPHLGQKGSLPTSQLYGNQQQQPQQQHFNSYHSDESNASCSNEEALSLAKLYPDRFPPVPNYPSSAPPSKQSYSGWASPPGGASYGLSPHAHHHKQLHAHAMHGHPPLPPGQPGRSPGGGGQRGLQPLPGRQQLQPHARLP